MNPYETDRSVAEYLLLHFGDAKDVLNGLPGPTEAVGFPTRCVRELVDTDGLESDARALDVGCAVGRSTFELARHCLSAVGVDSSKAFIETANRLRAKGRITTRCPVEGEITTPFTAVVPEDIERDNVEFHIDDACGLPGEMGPFDVVLAANLICRLPRPKTFLNRAAKLVRPGGQLVLTSPFTWLEDFTPEANWIGGKPGKRSLDALRQMLAPAFTLERQRDLPFLIREHARKFQYGIACGTRWRRR